MLLAARVVTVFLVLFLLHFTVTPTKIQALAQDPCPGQGHAPTAANIAAGYPADRKVCPKDEKIVTPESGEAKQYLNTLWCGGRPRTCGAHQDNVEQLDPAFSVCAARFLKAAKAQDPSICIRSAFRSKDNQACTCPIPVANKCAPAGGSNHGRGIAIDVNSPLRGESGVRAIHSMASQFGLRFPIPGPDPWHLQPGSGNCNTSGYTPFDMSTGVSGPPSSELSNAIRQALGMQQQPPPPPPPPPPPQQQAQQPQSQPPPIGSQNTTALPTGTCSPQFYCSNSTYYYRTSSCVDQIYQLCPLGCSASGTTCATSSSSAVSGNINIENANENSNINTSTSTDSYELIGEYAEDLVSDSIDIGTATSIALNPDTSDAVALLPSASTSRPALFPSSTTAASLSLNNPQTFTSQDLAKSPFEGFKGNSNTFILKALDAMRETLLYALNYLRPFGRPPDASGTSLYLE